MVVDAMNETAALVTSVDSCYIYSMCNYVFYIFMFEKVLAHKSKSKSYTSFLFLLLLFLLSLQSESRQSPPQYFDLSPQYLAEEVNLYPPPPQYLMLLID